MSGGTRPPVGNSPSRPTNVSRPGANPEGEPVGQPCDRPGCGPVPGDGTFGRDPGDGTLVAPLQIRILHSTRNGLSPAERWSCERPSLVLLQEPDDSRMTAFAPPPLFCRESALVRL